MRTNYSLLQTKSFKNLNERLMLFNAAHTFKAYISEYSTHSGKEDKLKTNILHTVEVKIHPRNFSNNEVPDLNENTSGSTNLAEKKARIG